MSTKAAAAAATPMKQVLAEADAAGGPIKALLANLCKAREAGIYFNTWEIVPDAETPIEHVLRHEFWANVSQRMKMGDTVIVVPRDGAWYAELVVFDAGQNWAHVATKFVIERPAFTAVAGVADDFEIRRDPIDGVVVRRKSTGAKVKGNFASHEEARKWLKDHQRALRN